MNKWQSLIDGFRARSLESHREQRKRFELRLEPTRRQAERRKKWEKQLPATYEPPAMSGDPDIDDIRYL